MSEHIGTRPAARCESCDKLVPLDDLRDFLCGGCRDDAAMWDLRAENERLREEMAKIAGWFERDRREPDKVLCHVASLRRAALARDGSPVATGREDRPEASDRKEGEG